MVTEPAILEQVTDEMMEMEPEVLEGSNTKIEFPYKNNLRLSNFIRFHHPDGTVSDIAAPTFNPAMPTPFRRMFLQYWLAKRGPNGKRWFFLTRQAPPAKLPFRCFVKPGGVQCRKRMQSLPDLFMHVMAKHGEESKLYGDFMKAIERKMQADVDPETLEMLGMSAIPKVEGQLETFSCRVDGCPRYFDLEKARDMHEKTGHKEKK